MLHCGCGGNRRLRYEHVEQEHFGLQFAIDNMPVLVCEACDAHEIPQALMPLLERWADQAKSRGETSVVITFRGSPPREAFVETIVPFDFDPNDYYLIPGLWRPMDDGFLTPVFFDIHVLDKYTNDARYRLDIVSETLGSIYSDDGHVITFGINESDRVIMWLGDIADLDEPEQYYLKSHNVDSDHDIASDFYDAQIMAVFTEPSKERLLLEARSAVNALALESYGRELYAVDPEIVRCARHVHRPTVYTRDNLCRSIAALNKLLVESVDTDLIREAIAGIDSTQNLRGLASNKLVERLLELTGPDTENPMLGQYVLYDWRLTCEHAMSGGALLDKLSSCADRLRLELHDVDDAAGLCEMYDALLTSLTVTLMSLETALGELPASQSPA